MSTQSILLKGLNEVLSLLGLLDKKVKKLVVSGPAEIGQAIKVELIRNTPVYSGALASKWTVESGGKGLVKVTNNSLYAEVVDTGSDVGSYPWPSAGKRTVKLGGKIWSSQAVGGMTKAIDDEFINNALEKYILSKL